MKKYFKNLYTDKESQGELPEKINQNAATNDQMTTTKKQI